MKNLWNKLKREDIIVYGLIFFIGATVLDVLFADTISWKYNIVFAFLPAFLAFIGHFIGYGFTMGVGSQVIKIIRDIQDAKLDELVEKLEELKADLTKPDTTPDASDAFDAVNGDEDDAPFVQGQEDSEGHKVYKFSTFDDAIQVLNDDQLRRFFQSLAEFKKVYDTHIEPNLNGKVAVSNGPITWTDDGTEVTAVFTNTPASGGARVKFVNNEEQKEEGDDVRQ